MYMVIFIAYVYIHAHSVYKIKQKSTVTTLAKPQPPWLYLCNVHVFWNDFVFQIVYLWFPKFQYTLSQETINYLKNPTFDIWHWEPNEVRMTSVIRSNHSILNSEYIPTSHEHCQNTLRIATNCDIFQQMLSLLEHMYHELDLVDEFNMNPVILKRWLVSLINVLSFNLFSVSCFLNNISFLASSSGELP